MHLEGTRGLHGEDACGTHDGVIPASLRYSKGLSRLAVAERSLVAGGGRGGKLEKCCVSGAVEVEELARTNSERRRFAVTIHQFNLC